MPYKADEPRRHKIPKARYKNENWAEFDAALWRLGSLTVWVEFAIGCDGFSRVFDAHVMREKYFQLPSFSDCCEHTLAQEIKVGAAIHLAFHEFEFVDPPLDRPGTPWQGERRFDGGPVALDTVGKAAQRALTRRRDPGIKGVNLLLADHGGEGPDQGHRFGDRRRGGDQRRHQVAFPEDAGRRVREHDHGVAGSPTGERCPTCR